MGMLSVSKRGFESESLRRDCENWVVLASEHAEFLTDATAYG